MGRNVGLLTGSRIRGGTRGARLVATAVLGTLLLGATATAVHAATYQIDAYIPLNHSGWFNGSTKRTTSGTTISATPKDLLIQGGPMSLRHLKVNDSKQVTLSATQSWYNATDTRSIISGVPAKTNFYFASCCRGSTDTYWMAHAYY